MATAKGTRENFNTMIEKLKRSVIETFEELSQTLEKRKQDLLSRLSAMKSAYENNCQLDEAIEQLRIAKESAVSAIRSNLLGEDLDWVKVGFDDKIRLKEKMKVSSINNTNHLEFLCLSDQIRRGIEETDIIELIPEYIGRENPILKTCLRGSKHGAFQNARGVAIDKFTNEVYIADKSNRRIQVMSANGYFLRSFGEDQLGAVHGVCLSKTDVFVTDKEMSLLKYNKSGKYLKKTGSRGIALGCFSNISGLCCGDGFVYVSDYSVQRIQVFDYELLLIKDIAGGEIQYPIDINFHSNAIYILSQDRNEIYCYSKDCQRIKTILLTGKNMPMSKAIFFAIDFQGNFIISEISNSEIRIFSPTGVLKHTLGRGHLKFLSGIALDNSNAIICVNYGIHNDCFQKY